MNSSYGEKLSISHLTLCLSLPAMRQYDTELILLPCFRAFKGRMRSPQVSPSSPMPLGCQISDPEAAKEMQLDVQVNMQSSNYKRKGTTHLTPVGGPGTLIA